MSLSSCGRAWLIALGCLGLLVVPLAVPAVAQDVGMSVGATQSSSVWQTSPNAFQDLSRSLTLRLSLAVDPVIARASVGLVNLRTLRPGAISAFDLSLRVLIHESDSYRLRGVGGLSVFPNLDWSAPFARLVLSRRVQPYLEIWGGPLIHTTGGARCCHSGTSLRLAFGLDVHFRLQR